MKSAGLLCVGMLLVASAAFTFQSRGASSQVAASTSALEAPAAAQAMNALIPPAAQPEVWRRPEGPIRVALQAGHWKSQEAPDEQSGLRGNGTRGGGKMEWEVNLEIAQRTAALLEAEGYAVEILPTTIPPGYWADLFVSIHADGHASTSASGYRASPPRRDATGRAAEFSTLLERTYGEATGLRHYPTVTRRMQNYYAFNWRRYDHALHPMTIAVILETGFLTSPNDRRIIVDSPERSARGIAEAVIRYAESMPPAPELALPAEYGSPRRSARRPVGPPTRERAELSARE